MNTRKFNLRYIIVHTINSMLTVHEVNNLHYHYLVTPSGRLICRKPPTSLDGTIDIAVMCDWDKQNALYLRTENQDDTLFMTLAELSEEHPGAKVLNADETVWPTGFIDDLIYVLRAA